MIRSLPISILTVFSLSLSHVSADLISHGDAFSGRIYNQAPYPQLNLLTTYSVGIPKFDPALGTLTGVSIEFTDLRIDDFALQIDNENLFPIDVAIRQNAEFSISARGASNDPVPGLGAWTSTKILSPDSWPSYDPSFNGPDTATLTLPGIGTPVSIQKNIASASLADYLGIGQINIGLKIVLTPDFQTERYRLGPTAPDPAYRLPDFYSSVPFSGSYRVEYQFDPVPSVPEPSSLALSGIAGLIVLVHASRRRSSRAPA